MRPIGYARRSRESNAECPEPVPVAFRPPVRSTGLVHPLLLVTLLGPLLALFGVVAQTAHRSQARADAKRDAAAGIAGLKCLVAAGDWGAALPPLMITAGLLWTMTFGAIAMAVVFEQRLSGLLMATAPIWAIARIVRDWRRA
jgi:hypothetical protein